VYDKKSDAAIEKFKEICSYFTKLHRADLFNDSTTKDMLELITSSLTDNASDVAKFCQFLKLHTANPEDFKKLFCNIHKLAIASRDVAVL